MLNQELREILKDFPGSGTVLIVNPGTDGEEAGRYALGKVTYLTNSDPVDTIIEAEENDGMTAVVATLRDGLRENDPAGTVQVFVPSWEGQHYAYFDIAEVRERSQGIDIVLGAWRCGS